jgi:putative peptidoglycan lipid II flippase
MNEESYQRTERGARLVGAGIIVSRVLGLVRNKVFAQFFGDTMQADVYNAASRIPNVLRNLLGEGAISASFVPVYAAALERGDEKGARALANALLGVLLAGVAVLTLLGITLAPVLTAVLTPGFTGEKAELTTRLLRVMFPMTGLMVLSGWCLGVQNAHRRFFMAYASGAMWSIAQIALLLVAGPRTGDLTKLVWWLSWATLAGSVLQIGAQVPQVLRLMETVRPTLDRGATGLRETLSNFVPVVGALGLFQISSFIDQGIASFLPTAALTNLNFAFNLYLLPLSLFGVATAAAALPQMARDSVRDGATTLGPGLSRAWERVLFYTIPSAIAFAGIGDCLVALLYEGGKFHAEQRRIVHVILAAYALGLVAYASSRLLASSYQATRNYRAPFRSAAWAISVSAAVGASIALPFRDQSLAVAGLALGGAVGAHINLALLWRGLRAQIGPVDLDGPTRVARTTLGVAVIALIPSLGLRIALRALPIHVTAVLVIALYCAVFLWAAQRAGLDEAGRLISSVSRRMRRT